MATSPDYLRLAAHATRALADTALDSLPNAVLIVDARRKHLPLVLANTAARRALATQADAIGMMEAPLTRFLGAASVSAIESMLASVTEAPAATSRTVNWRCVPGEMPIMTDITPLASASAGQRLVMLTFTPVAKQPDLAAVIDELPLDLLLLDTELKVTFANAGGERAGASIPGGAVGCSVLMLTPTSALHPDVYARALEGRHYHDDTLAVTQPERPTRWFEIDIRPLKNATGVVGLVVMFNEVTERRMQNRAQGSSERRMLALTEHARDIITVAARNGQLQYVSGGVRNSLGYTSEERESNYIFEHVHPEDHDAVRTKYQQLVDGEFDSFSHEFRVRHKDGSYRWLESSYSSALDNPLIGGVVINSRDVTERKQAEFRLAQREEVFRLAAEAVDGVIFEWDIPRGIVRRSRGVSEVLGVSAEDLETTLDAWLERVHPADFRAARKAVGLALINGRGWTITYRIRDVRGRYKSILERGIVQRNAAGDPVRAIGCAVDVSEIKRLTDLLGETQRIAKMGGWEYHYSSGELLWSDEMYRIYDTTPARFEVTLASVVGLSMPESRQKFAAAIQRAEAGGGPLDLELQICSLSQACIWVRIMGHVEMLDGKPFRALGSMQNIQDSKTAQIALENSTGWLKQSMTMAHLHAWRWDKAQDSFEFANLEGQKIHLPSVYPGMSTMLTHVHPEDLAAVKRAIDTAFTRHVEVRQEFRIQGTDDRYRAYATTARPLFNAAGEPRGLVGVIQDVTARRESEQRLRQSEELLRATTTNSADTLILVDTAFRVRFINHGVNGLSVAQIINRDIGDLLPRGARAGVFEKFRHILESGETATYEFESIEDGQVKYFDNRAVWVRDDGIGAGISISMRDITERKRLEQEILDVSGRERQRIGSDLHDGLGQELTGVALMLRGLATRIQSRCPDVVDNVNEVVGLVNQSIETARSLARGLLPVRSETGGLASALGALAARGRDLYGLDVVFRDDTTPEFTLSETDASHLYRIAQEALTNATRHGRAGQVDIVLHAAQQSFSLRITDDGDGMPSADAPRSDAPRAGMGLKIMQYRAGMIGAKFSIEANVPHGTTVHVSGERPMPGKVQSA